MRIAAVITAYNSAGTIERALESVLQQTRAADQIIVVDDGSQDQTCARVRRFDRVKLVERLNGGPAAARNSGIAATDADWIAFLDGDDYWLPEKLARIDQAIIAHPEASVLFSSVMAVDGDSMREYARAREWVLGVEEVMQGCPIVSPTSAVVRKSAIDSAGAFNENQRDGEDWEFWLRMAEEGPIRRVQGPLAVYYLHDGGWHTRYVETRTEATKFLSRAAIRLLRRRGLAALPDIRDGFANHFRAFTYFASTDRRVGLTAATGLLATLVDPLRGGYAAGRGIFRLALGR